MKPYDEMNRRSKNVILYYPDMDYEMVFNTLKHNIGKRNDIVFCAGQCYY